MTAKPAKPLDFDPRLLAAVYRTEDAKALAQRLTRDDEDAWIYQVQAYRPESDSAIVVVRDAEGEFLGYL